MDPYQPVADKLNALNIDFQLVEHEPALTTEQADQFIEGIPSVRTKTMFLTDKKKRQFYLVIMDDSQRLDMDRFQEITGESKIKLGFEDSLQAKMSLYFGIVSPFGLLNNTDRDIQNSFDQAIMDKDRMSFHPNTNEKTIFITTPDLLTFLDHLGYTPHIVEL
ncbi:prolyl-tRNA synthetase associated domain-containing protein [Dolosigranulum pigrum]|uniref:prolyl-tRNA synthetase associated domain-containing protein n=1 Tax=Dolosigranulum pigrum TaxID=29394 RepID=UPI001AD88E42|nr:prolyl-tRNA synthetase associated domain-containing protein [Dolosigranulum pigrum]QTJ36225.1 prolyl-tRNA synthetase associated domain-containing protein [Dolosigranulum pigrum]